MGKNEWFAVKPIRWEDVPNDDPIGMITGICPGQKGYEEPKGCTIERGEETTPPVTPRNKKGSDSLLGHQITGFTASEGRQAAKETMLRRSRLGSVTQQKDTSCPDYLT